MEILGFDLSSWHPAAWWPVVRDFALPRVLPTFGIALLAATVWLVARFILTRVERRWVTKTATSFDDHLVRLVRQALLVSTIMWGIWRTLDIWALEQAASWTTAIWIGLLFFPLGGFVGAVLESVERRVVHRTETTLDDTALPLINKVVRFVVVAVGAIITLDHLGLNVAPLLAGAGVMGLALSLAAKDTLSNLIAGVLLIMDRPFQVGDRIELWTAPDETGTWGDVIEIGLRATKIRNPDNLIVVVPNNEIMRRDIVNYTMSGSNIRLRIPFSVAYESDIETAKRVLRRIANETEGVESNPAPVAIVRGFGPSEVNLQLRVWIQDARARRAIADHITERAMTEFASAGVEIPYPKREVFLKPMNEVPT